MSSFQAVNSINPVLFITMSIVKGWILVINEDNSVEIYSSWTLGYLRDERCIARRIKTHANRGMEIMWENERTQVDKEGRLRTDVRAQRKTAFISDKWRAEIIFLYYSTFFVHSHVLRFELISLYNSKFMKHFQLYYTPKSVKRNGANDTDNGQSAQQQQQQEGRNSPVVETSESRHSSEVGMKTQNLDLIPLKSHSPAVGASFGPIQFESEEVWFGLDFLETRKFENQNIQLLCLLLSQKIWSLNFSAFSKEWTFQDIKGDESSISTQAEPSEEDIAALNRCCMALYVLCEKTQRSLWLK